MNAILNKNSADVAGCSMYVALFPCNECAKMIIQSGIKDVVYFSDKHASKPETIASKRMFDFAGIKYRYLAIYIQQLSSNCPLRF
jgi:dCMP deaminase